MIRHALQYSALLASFLISATADASPLLILDSSGHWLGASDVTVDGNDYDLTFAQGSCAAVFGACGDDRFAFTTSLSALSAQHAIDTMAHDGSFENNPQLISLGVSGIITPYAVASSVLTWTTFFHDRGAPDLENDGYSASLDSIWNDSVWAVWTRAPDPPSTTVPEPSSMLLLSVGLAGLIAVRFREGSTGWTAHRMMRTFCGADGTTLPPAVSKAPMSGADPR